MPSPIWMIIDFNFHALLTSHFIGRTFVLFGVFVESVTFLTICHVMALIQLLPYAARQRLMLETACVKDSA